MLNSQRKPLNIEQNPTKKTVSEMFKTTTNKQGYVIVTKLQKIPTKKHPPTKTTFNTIQLNYQQTKK